jgi:hypothetical protein
MTKTYTRSSLHSRYARTAFFTLLLCMSAGLLNKAGAQYLPRPDHIIILIEENQPNAYIIGTTTPPLQSQPPNVIAPYINALANDTDAVVLEKFYAIEHPSQPDYLDLFSGNNQGVLDDNLPANYPFTTPNLAYELLHKGLSFITYSQELPAEGSDAQNGTVGSYARKHNPVTNWIGTGANQVPDTCNQMLTQFPTDYSTLPLISYVVPDEDSDMHNGSYPATATVGDFWMHEHLDSLFRWIKNNNALFIYTFDEDDGFYSNNIPCIFYGPMVKGGTNNTTYNFYSLLRTLEDMYSLGEHAGAAASAIDITDIWRTPTGINNIGPNVATLQVYPNPASGAVSFDGTKLSDASGEIAITDVTGRVVSRFDMPQTKKLVVNTSEFTAGLYFYHFQHGSADVETGKFVVAR